MYRTSTGEEIFVIDGHVHLWDASPENILNKYGEGFINCFYDYHRNLSPQEYLWDRSLFARYGREKMVRDLFVDGYVDMAIFQPTYLKDFYRNGFNTTEQNAVLKEMYPDRFILNGAFDPRDGEAGLEYLETLVENYGIRGVKLYTAEWRGNSKGWKLTDLWAYRYLEKCEELGIKNIHVHKGPTIWPLNRDAFDVADVDEAASAFPNLNFIVEHCGIPRIDDFCWIATQEPNVYGGLAVVMPFIHSRPRYFAEVLANLIWWVGEDRLLFGSDYGIWHPRWLVERFMAFDFPEDIKEEFGFELTLDVKKKILGENAARLYGIDIEAQKKRLARDPIGAGR
ncbi:MAG: amidohydrolase [Bacillota bacterium]|nr:MAG: amidohydrolase [Bacillota bacterium]